MMKRMMVAGALLLTVAAVLTTGVPLRAEILEQVLVKVNGDIVTKTEFEQRQVSALRDRPEFANANPSSIALQKAIGEITPDLILDAVEELLLIQRARELNYALGDEQYRDILENMKKSSNITDDAQFQAALKQEGLTEADLRRNIERSMMVTQVQRNEVVQKIGVTEEEARAFYEAHRSEFTTPSEMTLREILIEVPSSDKGVNVAQDDEARAKADEIRQRVVAGEPFARLAAELSASASKANGGLIGPIRSDELAPQLRQMLDKLKVGEVAPVVRTTLGYQILKLESRTETKIRTFEDARAAIADRVVESKRRAALQKYLDVLREQASIVWRNTELKRAYDLALTRRRQQIEAATPAGPV
jgi:peptidyl-prolyl cis-trans isomerase SurA